MIFLSVLPSVFMEEENCTTDLSGTDDMISKNSSETTRNIKIINSNKAVKKKK